MGKILRNFFIFLLCFFLIITLITPIFVPKFLDGLATTAVIDGFYELENNSIDVIFLGSSQVMTAVSPMQIYNDTGISSYNLGTEQQNLVTSYYLLEEALRFQSPKVVVLDMLFLFPYYNESALNSKEEFVRKSFDYMKWSANKWEAINTICTLDNTHKIQNYLFPFLRYHSRWAELNSSDFTYLFKNKENPLKGFSIVTDNEVFDFSGFSLSTSSAQGTPVDTMLFYFEKIVSTCQENDIHLLLIKTPRGNGSWGEAYHNTVQTLAEKYDLPFLDYNEKTLFEAINFNPDTDYQDASHVNYYGAVKITKHLSCYLSNHYDDLEDIRNNPAYDSWQKDYEVYQSYLNP